MKYHRFALLCGMATAAALLAVGFAGAQGFGDGGFGRGMGHGHGMRHGRLRGHHGNPVRHRVVRHGDGVPRVYASMKNPHGPSKSNLKAGERLYKANCASCHGASGEGDGAAGQDLRYKPANLAFVVDKWIATDGFLMWSIAEGGEELKTDMPAFKDALTETERWQIITFMRRGL